METSKVGKIISKLRKEKELTQQELGDLLGVSPKTISKWETGKGLPDISILNSISKILNIKIEDLLEGTLPIKNIEVKNNNKKYVIALLLIILVILVIMLVPKNNNEQEETECIIIRTYDIDNIGKSNDENYLYITIHEYQVEGTYTIKLPKVISNTIEVGSSYEFTFKADKDYLNLRTDFLFYNSEIINLEYTDKKGMERTSKSYCGKKGEYK